MAYLKIVTAIAGIGMSFAYYPQLWKIWKTKSAAEVSLVSYVIFSIGTTIWALYGLILKDPVIFWSFIFGVIGSWGVLISLLKFNG